MVVTEGVDAPLREIARRSHVGLATLYRHFPTKAQLLSEALDEDPRRCRSVIRDGLAASDPLEGLRDSISRLMTMRALSHARARATPGRPTSSSMGTAERAEALRLLEQLVVRARDSGTVRRDLTTDDVVLALMANDGIRVGNSALTATAARRFATLILDGFRPVAHHRRAPSSPAE